MRSRVAWQLWLSWIVLPLVQLGACAPAREYAEPESGDPAGDEGSAGEGAIPNVDAGEAGALGESVSKGGAAPGSGGTTGVHGNSGGTVNWSQGGIATGGFQTGGRASNSGGAPGRVSCPLPPSPQNGSVQASGDVGSDAVYECSVGYKLSGPPKRACQTDGTWSGAAPTCEPLNCGALPTAPYVKYDVPCSTYACTATAGCESGYGSTAYPIFTCTKAGTWDGLLPTCTPCRVEAESDTLAYWLLEDGSGQSFRDSGPNQLNGVLGATTSAETSDPTWTTKGRFGSGLAFDRAKNQFLRVNRGISFSSGQFTIEVWVRPSAGISEVLRSNAVILKLDVPSKIEWQISNGTTWTTVSVTADVRADTWHTVALTYDGAAMRTYMDSGQFTESMSASVTLPAPTEFYLGGQGDFLNGTLGPIRISSTAHSRDKITTDANAGRRCTPP